MKKTLFFSLSLALLLFFSNCDNADKLADVKFDVTLYATLPVAAATTDPIKESIVIDAATDPEIMKYLDKIKGYEITELLFSIEDYNSSLEDEIYFNGDIGFSRIIDANPFKKCSVQFLNVTHWAGTGYFDIDLCNDLFNEIGEMLLADDGVKIYLTGSFDKAPLTFNLKVKVKMKVTANPL